MYKTTDPVIVTTSPRFCATLKKFCSAQRLRCAHAITHARTMLSPMKSSKSTAAAGGWRTKVRKGMIQTCLPEKVDEALARVLAASEDVQERARDTFCPPYKTARWKEFLVFVVSWEVAKDLVPAGEDSLSSPVNRTLPSSVARTPTAAKAPAARAPVSLVPHQAYVPPIPLPNVYSPRARPPPPTRAPKAALAPKAAPAAAAPASAAATTTDRAGAHAMSPAMMPNEQSSLDYVALAAMGFLLVVVAVAFSPGTLTVSILIITTSLNYITTCLYMCRALWPNNQMDPSRVVIVANMKCWVRVHILYIYCGEAFSSR